MAGSKEAMEVSKVPVTEIEVFEFRRKVDAWTIPPRLILVETVCARIMYFVVSMCKNARCSAENYDITLSQLSGQRFGRFYTKYVETIMLSGTSATRLTVKKWMLSYQDAGQGSINPKKGG